MSDIDLITLTNQIGFKLVILFVILALAHFVCNNRQIKL